MRNDELKLRVLTEMSNTNGNPLDKGELRAKLETARFEELMYWERKKRFLLRMKLYVLIAILVSINLQPWVPYLAAHLSEIPNGIEAPLPLDLTPFLPARRHLP